MTLSLVGTLLKLIYYQGSVGFFILLVIQMNICYKYDIRGNFKGIFKKIVMAVTKPTINNVKGKFYGSSNYPKCKFILKNK